MSFILFLSTYQQKKTVFLPSEKYCLWMNQGHFRDSKNKKYIRLGWIFNFLIFLLLNYHPPQGMLTAQIPLILSCYPSVLGTAFGKSSN